MKKKYLIERRYVEVGGFLRAARLRKGFTQKQVADELGYSSMQFISNFECGIAVPPVSKLKVMVRMYEMPIGPLIDIIQTAERRVLELALKGKLVAKARRDVG